MFFEPAGSLLHQKNQALPILKDSLLWGRESEVSMLVTAGFTVQLQTGPMAARHFVLL
jgi:hypothetical protein